MFVLEQYDEIILHLKTISSVFKRESSGWYSIFCPYCDDAIRKLNPKHGHFHLAPSYPYGHCFRCGIHVGLDKLLYDTKFTNIELIKKLRIRSGFTYGNVRKFKSDSSISESELYKKFIDYYNWFYNNYPNELNQFKEYINIRCYDINPIKFFIMPVIYNGQIAVQFLNYDGQLVTTRTIFNSEMRYIIPKIKHFYYFQDFSNIDEYNNIIITEGAFDLINLNNYYLDFDNQTSFYLALSGNNYKGLIIELITNYLMIGKYNIHVVLDNGLKFLDQTIKSIISTSNELNPEINNSFYLPKYSKDVSECMALIKI